MKLLVNIQIGLKDQYIFRIDENGNVSKIAQIELNSLGDALCGLYTADINGAIIRGPKEMALKVESDARECRLALFGKDDMNIMIE